MHTFMYLVFLRLWHDAWWIHVVPLHIFFRVASRTVGHYNHCPPRQWSKPKPYGIFGRYLIIIYILRCTVLTNLYPAVQCKVEPSAANPFRIWRLIWKAPASLAKMFCHWQGWNRKPNINTLTPRQVAAIFQTIFSNAFSWMKMHKFRLRFHWILFLRIQSTIFQHWFR